MHFSLLLAVLLYVVTTVFSTDLPLAPTDVQLNGVTISWTSVPDLSYRITACLVVTECSFETRCTGCHSVDATNLQGNRNYTITVYASRIVNGIVCDGETSASIFEGISHTNNCAALCILGSSFMCFSLWKPINNHFLLCNALSQLLCV